MATARLTKPASRRPSLHHPIGIYYEHPLWFQRLFEELDRRQVPYVRLDAKNHHYDPAHPPQVDPQVSLVFNRMSPSAYRRGNGHGIYYTLNLLSHLEHQGTRVVNGVRAFRHEISKALQLSLLRSLGLAFPKSRVIQHAAQAPAAAADLRFPVMVKPNVGGSGAGVLRFETPAQLAEAVAAGSLDLGLDHVALVQEFIPARGGCIHRVEVVGGKFLYAIKVYVTGETFDLCPADICKTTAGVELASACAVEAAKAGLRVEGFPPPPQVISEVENIMHHAGIDVGGVEYLIDDRDGELLYYDLNALSNFVSDGPQVVGFDPFVPLVDYLEAEAIHANEGE